MSAARPPKGLRIWALLGARRGDNNQVLALAEALGLPFETKQLSYNYWRHLQPPLLGATLRSLDSRSRQLVAGEPPDLTISAGHRSVPVVQALRQRSGGRTRSVHVGYPRISPGKFDLVIATPEYPIPDHPNLLRVPFALTVPTARNDAAKDRFWDAYPKPRRLLILGGPTLYWRIDPSAVRAAVHQLLAAAQNDGGSLLVVGSPRTPARLLGRLREWLRSASVPAALVPADGPPNYRNLLAHADIIAVTSDSVAMVSDAITTGKPVALVPVAPSLTGRVIIGIMDRLRPGRRLHPRDLRFFWSSLEQHGLVGTIAEPRRGEAPDLTGRAAAQVRAILKSA